MEPMDLDICWAGKSLEVTVERRLEVLLLLSAAEECSLEVYCLLADLVVEVVLLLPSHWILLLLLLGMDYFPDRADHLILDHCRRLDQLVDLEVDRLLLLPLAYSMEST